LQIGLANQNEKNITIGFRRGKFHETTGGQRQISICRFVFQEETGECIGFDSTKDSELNQ
jgi:hypothetical protein